MLVILPILTLATSPLGILAPCWSQCSRSRSSCRRAACRQEQDPHGQQFRDATHTDPPQRWTTAGGDDSTWPGVAHRGSRSISERGGTCRPVSLTLLGSTAADPSVAGGSAFPGAGPPTQVCVAASITLSKLCSAMLSGNLGASSTTLSAITEQTTTTPTAPACHSTRFVPAMHRSTILHGLCC